MEQLLKMFEGQNDFNDKIFNIVIEQGKQIRRLQEELSKLKGRNNEKV